MPARWLLPRCRHIFTLVPVLCVLSASVAAQSSVALRATVSEVVTLSVAANSNFAIVNSGGNTVRITLPVDDAADLVIRVPLLVRSNSSFKISANLESGSVEPTKVLVTDVHATGNWVSPNVVNAVEVKRKAGTAQPLLVVTGPRVSLGGTLTSPNNALQITVLIHLPPQPTRGPVHLSFVATAGSLTP